MNLTLAALASSISVPVLMAVLLICWSFCGRAIFAYAMVFVLGGFASFVLAMAASRILMPVEAIVAGAPGSVRANLIGAFLGAALPEEAVRLVIAICSMVGMRNFAAGRIVVTCGMIGLGFAMFENLLYSVTTLAGIEVLVERTLPTVSHGATALIMGSFLERAFSNSRERRTVPFLLSLAVPCLLHGLYDFGAFEIEAREFPDLPDDPTFAELKPLGAVLSPILIASSVGLVELIWGGRIIWGLRKKSVSR